MAENDVDSQKELEEIEVVVSACETIANEIGKKFSEFETTLEDSETKSKELITELDSSCAEVVKDAEEFQAALTNKVEEIQERVNKLVADTSTALKTVDSNSNSVFGKLKEMDKEHSDIKTGIEENSTHIKEIFDTLKTNWTQLDDKIKTLQDEQHENISTDINELSETKLGELETDKEEIIKTLSAELEETITNTQSHLQDVANDYKENFITGVEAATQKNKDIQEQGGTNLKQERTQKLEEMFTNCKGMCDSAETVINTMKTTVKTTAGVADVTVDAMDKTNLGLNQLTEAVENVTSLLGGLSLD